jgi:hypothetical protein
MNRVAGPVRLRGYKSFVERCGLTFITVRNYLARALKVNPHQPLWFDGRSGRIGLRWTRSPYAYTVFASPPCQACNSPTARP